MSGIIHIQQQSSALRLGLIAVAVLTVAGLAAQALGVFDRPAGVGAETSAPAAQVAPATSGQAVVKTFPGVRVRLLEVSPASGAAASARLEVEGRSAGFRVGQEVFPGVTLRRVALDHVVLAYAELTRTVLLSPVTPGAPQAGAEEVLPERNKNVDVRRLTFTRFNSADSFLREVELAPHPRGGFVVRSVVPESLYEKAGLRVGDVLYSLDTDKTAKIDDRSMEAVIGQTHYELDVYRNGQLVPLRYRFPTSDPEPEGGTPPTADAAAAGGAGGR